MLIKIESDKKIIIKKDKKTIPKDLKPDFKLRTCFVEIISPANIQNCVKKIAYPVIFLSFLSRASEISGKKIHVIFDKNEILLNLNVNIYSNFFHQEFPNFLNEIEIKFLNNQDSFTESEWNSLYKLAENTFVEESDSLKQGAAGAGLTDND